MPSADTMRVHVETANLHYLSLMVNRGSRKFSKLFFTFSKCFSRVLPETEISCMYAWHLSSAIKELIKFAWYVGMRYAQNAHQKLYE